jgi:hypothetical protein
MTAPRSRSTLIVVALAVLVVLLPACQRGRVGQRCSTKDFGDDGGAWVLVCRNGRWQRALTKADAARIMFPPTTAAPATTTPPTPPTTAPAPAPAASLRSFGPGTHVVSNNGVATSTALPWGFYATTVPAGATCHAETATTGARGRLGILVVKLPYGTTAVAADGPCTWTVLDDQDPTYGGTVFTKFVSSLEFPGGPGCNVESLTEPPSGPGYEWATFGTLGPVVRSVGTFRTWFGAGGAAMTDPRPAVVIARGCGTPVDIGAQSRGVHLVRGTSLGDFTDGAAGDWLYPRHPIGFVGGTSSATLTFGPYTAEISFTSPGWGTLRVSGCNTIPTTDAYLGGYTTDAGTGLVDKVFGLSIRAVCDDGTQMSLGATVG